MADSSRIVNPLDEEEPETGKLVKKAEPTSSEPVLTAEQLRIRELEAKLAELQSDKAASAEVSEPVKTSPGNDGILIHFLEDGFTALGKSFYRGDELEFAPDSQAYKDTCDKNGRSWLELRHDEYAQVDRYGKIMFRSGPWPGKDYKAAAGKFQRLASIDSGKPLPGLSEEDLERVNEMARRSKRQAPTLPR